MTIQEANTLIKKILKEEYTEVGVFISLLSNAYIEQTGMTEKHFMLSLKNSLKILKSKGE